MEGYKIFVARVANFTISFLSILVIGRFWGAAGEGVYSIITSMFVVLNQFSIFGIDHSILNFYASKDASMKNRIEGSIFFHSFFIAPVVMGLFFIVGNFFIRGYINNNFVYLMIIAAFCANVFTAMYHSIAICRKDIFHYTRLLLSRSLLLFLLLLYFAFWGYDKNYIIVAFSIAWIGEFLLVFFCDFDFFKKVKIRNYLNSWRLIVSQSKWIYLTSLLFVINLRGVIFILKYFTDIKQAGILFIAVAAGELLYFLPGAFGDVLLKDMSQMDDDKKKEVLISTYRKLFVFTFILAIIGSFVFYNTVGLISEEFLESRKLFFIMLPGIFLLSLSRILGSYFLSISKPKYGAYSMIAAVLTTVVAGFILIPKMGVTGAAYTILLSYLVSCGVDYYFIIRNEGLSFFNRLINPFADKTI